MPAYYYVYEAAKKGANALKEHVDTGADVNADDGVRTNSFRRLSHDALPIARSFQSAAQAVHLFLRCRARASRAHLITWLRTISRRASQYGWTAVMQASNYDMPDALKVLIDAGADVHRAANVRATRVPAPLVTRSVSTRLLSHVLSPAATTPATTLSAARLRTERRDGRDARKHGG